MLLKHDPAKLWIAKKIQMFLVIFIEFPRFSWFFNDYHIKNIFFGLDLVRIGSGICLKAIFCLGCSRRFFFLKKDTFLEMWTWQILKKHFLSCFWSVVAPAGAFFFWQNAHFHIFGHGNFPKSEFLVKNHIFAVINCQNIDILRIYWDPWSMTLSWKKINCCESTAG